MSAYNPYAASPSQKTLPSRASHDDPPLMELTLSRRPDGGYDPGEVDSALARFKEALQNSDAERTALKADLAQLRSEEQDGQNHESRAVTAVDLLSQAQVIADQCIADAEVYSRDLMVSARTQYQEIIERAESEASARRDASQPGTAPTTPATTVAAADPNQLDAITEKVDFIRTYAKVAQVQMRAVIDALTEQVDRLGDPPQLDDEVPGEDAVRPSQETQPTQTVQPSQSTQPSQTPRSAGSPEAPSLPHRTPGQTLVGAPSAPRTSGGYAEDPGTNGTAGVDWDSEPSSGNPWQSDGYTEVDWGS